MLSIDEDITSYEPPITRLPDADSNTVDRYRIWRKHVRDLYQTLFVHIVDYPTMTIQVLPYVRQNQKHNTIEHSLVTGSCREPIGSVNPQSYISILKAVTPAPELGTSLPINPETGEVGDYGHAPATCGMHTEMRIYHDGGVRRVRYVPWNPNILVSMSTDGNGYVFDKTEIAISKKPNNPARPLLPLAPDRSDETEDNSMSITQESKRIKYASLFEEQQRFDADTGKGQHKLALSGGKPGNGPAPLDTSVNHLGTVVSAAGKELLVWDILDYQCPVNVPEKRTSTEVSPRVITEACGIVNDVKFSKIHGDLVYAACEGRNGLCIFDVRIGSNAALYARMDAYAVSVDPSPFLAQSFAVGTSDGKIELRDNRKLSSPLSSFQAHEKNTEVGSVLWSIHNPNLLASAGEDGNVIFSDCPEGSLRFKHAGHTGAVDDISWSWVDSHKGMLASMSSGDDLCMMWKPRNHIWRQ